MSHWVEDIYSEYLVTVWIVMIRDVLIPILAKESELDAESHFFDFDSSLRIDNCV